MEVSEKKATTVRAGASRAYRELEGPRLLVYYILDLLRFHNIVQSEYCVLLHGASELGVGTSTSCDSTASSFSRSTGHPSWGQNYTRRRVASSSRYALEAPTRTAVAHFSNPPLGCPVYEDTVLRMNENIVESQEVEDVTH